MNETDGWQDQGEQQLKEYQILEKLGNGGFANVYLAVKDGQNFAVKIFELNGSKKQMEQITKELQIFEELNHPNIVKFIEAIFTKEKVYFVMEYLSGGALSQKMKKMIKEKQYLTEKEAAQITYSFASALKYLHSKGIIHRDVKPQNIMFTNATNNYKQIKLIDFGLSIYTSEINKCNCGTPFYQSPETMRNEYCGFSIDIWGIGVILYMLLMKGIHPFYKKHHEKIQMYNILKNTTVKISSELSKFILFLIIQIREAKELIIQSLKFNPSERIKIKELINHA